MAEMEKEGRPPENKRSRKPAHPVKREINEEMKVKRRGSVPRSCMSLRVVVRSVHVYSTTKTGVLGDIHKRVKCSSLHGCRTFIHAFLFLFPYVVFVCFPFKWQPRRRAALHVGCGTIHWSCSVVSLEKRERAPVIISLCLCLYVSLCGVCVCVRQSLRGLLRVNGKSNASVKASTVALLLLLILFHYMRV